MSLPVSLAQLSALVESAVKPENSKKRKFTQSVEVSLKLTGVDVSKSGVKINELLELPVPGKEAESVKILVISSGPLGTEARRLGIPVLAREDLEKLAGNKKEIRKLANQYDHFIAEAPMMPLVGRVMGQILGPRDKMPIAVPPTGSIASTVERLRRSVRLRLKAQPVVSCKIGNEPMKADELASNIQKVLSAVESKLPNGEKNVDCIIVKTSMGKPAKLKLKSAR
ncbi:MAG: 50S ribosomal protein L1 [Thermoproteota archaeon]